MAIESNTIAYNPNTIACAHHNLYQARSIISNQFNSMLCQANIIFIAQSGMANEPNN